MVVLDVTGTVAVTFAVLSLLTVSLGEHIRSFQHGTYKSAFESALRFREAERKAWLLLSLGLVLTAIASIPL